MTQSHAIRIDGYSFDDPRKVVLRDAIAFWSSEGHELSVVCYPFILSQEDVDALRRHPADAVNFGRHDKQRNPDPERWQRTPSLLLKFCCDLHKEMTVDDVTTTYVELWFGGQFPMSTTTRRQLGLAGIERYRGQPKDYVQSLALTQDNNRKVLEVVATGECVFKDECKGWNIRLATYVYDEPPRE